MIDVDRIIARFYRPGSVTHGILVAHGRAVAVKAEAAAQAVRHLDPDLDFIRQASMLHDIGILFTHSPKLGCGGVHPYVCHGVLGRALLEAEGLRRHARVCERHVGVGITVADIDRQGLPLPRRDMRPRSLEEQIICYADKFFSKNGGDPAQPKTMGQVLASLRPYGSLQTSRFTAWVHRFGDLEDEVDERTAAV